MAREHVITELILFACFIDLIVADICYHNPCDDFDICDYGCCGSGCDTYCCPNIVAIVVGSVIAGIFIIAFAGFCVWLLCARQKCRSQSGAVVGPTTYTTTTVVNGPHPGHQVHMINQPAGPQFGPGYNQPGYTGPGAPPVFTRPSAPDGPFSSGGSAIGGGHGAGDPAYPPGPATY